MKRKRLGRALVIALAVLSGCAHQYAGRATVLEEGQAQLTPSAEVDFFSLRGEEQSTNIPWAQAAMGYHQGIGNRVELGLRTFGFGIPGWAFQCGVAADSKFQLFKADDREWGWDLAIGLSPTYHFAVQGDQPFHLFGFHVPLLIGKNFGRHQLVLGLKLADYVSTSYGQRTINTIWVGTSLGLSLRVKRVEIFPEISFMYSPIKFNGERPDEKRNGVAYVTFGLAIPINLGGG
jgi:hypothetical protein